MPPPNSATAAASQPSGPDPNLLPYPRQSLTDVFRGSTEPQQSQAVAMPHPPSTYYAVWPALYRRPVNARRPAGSAPPACSARRRSGAGE